MYQINKNRAPNLLTQYKMQFDASYENLPQDVRVELKLALLEEQGYVCVYCMKQDIR